MRHHSLLTAILFAALHIHAVSAAEKGKAIDAQDVNVPDVGSIVEKANRVAYYQGLNGSAHVSMTIKEKNGQTRVRKLVILRMDETAPKNNRNRSDKSNDIASNEKTKEPEAKEKDGSSTANVDDADAYCGEQKMYVYFTRPADVNRTSFLVWKHLDRDDDRWIYLPALDLKKRISSTDKRTSFIGSHFFYEDVSGRNIDADNHELVETTDNYYVIKNTPKNPGSVEFASYTVWIHRKTFLPIKTEYYDKDGKAFRAYQVLKVETIQGYPTVTEATMTDLRTGGSTTVEYSNVKYDIELPAGIFSERYLRNPPRKYLR